MKLLKKNKRSLVPTVICAILIKLILNLFCVWFITEGVILLLETGIDMVDAHHSLKKSPFEISFILGSTKEEIVAEYGEPPQLHFYNLRKKQLSHKSHQEILYPLADPHWGICICFDETGIAHAVDLFHYDSATGIH